MPLLSLRSLGMTLGMPLFSELDLTIEPGDRLAVVAANGRGKSTLLNLIAGRLEPSSGDIIRARSLTLGYMEQEPPARLMPLSLAEAVADILPPEARDYEQWRADLVIDELGIDEPLRARPLGEQSGGWQRLALIARLAVGDPDLMLLDEPTNHLDLSKILRMERWLDTLPKDKAMVIVSHDRAFLDRIANRTLFLRHPKSVVYSLPYSPARDALAEADLAQDRQFDRDMKAAAQLRRQAATLKNIGINSGSDLLTVKTKQLGERAQRIEDQAEAAYKNRSAGMVELSSSASNARVLIQIAPFELRLGDGTLLFRSGPQFLCKGDRVILLGVNGAGKSRFVERLQRAIADGADAEIRPTPSLKPGYMDQALALLSGAKSPLMALTQRFALADQRARNLLAGAGIAPEKLDKPLERLSGGQRARLALLILRLTEPNFFLLDEPTNHLDIEAQEALQAELSVEDRAALIVSHDRTFIRETGNRFWLIDRRKLVEIDSPEAFFRSLEG